MLRPNSNAIVEPARPKPDYLGRTGEASAFPASFTRALIGRGRVHFRITGQAFTSSHRPQRRPRRINMLLAHKQPIRIKC